jgi:two-component system, NarL family, sensor histidine kinase EvgS
VRVGPPKIVRVFHIVVPAAGWRHTLAVALLAWLVWLPWCLPAQAQGNIELSPAERAWVAANPVVRVGVSIEFPPYYFSKSQGRYEGFVIELMDRLAARAGLRLEYKRYALFGETLEALKRKEIELTPFTTESAARHEYLSFVRPLFATQMVYVARRDLSDVSPQQGFSGYRVAVEKLSAAADLMRERFPQTPLREYDTSEQAVLAAATGDADVYVGHRQVAVYYMEKNLTANLALRGTMATQGTTLGPAVRKELVELQGILNKAIADLSTEEIAQLAAKWLPRSLLVAEPRVQAKLSEAQQAWIKQRGALRLGFDSEFAPIAFANIAGGFDGLAADLTRAMAAKVGLLVALEQGGTFADIYERAQRGDLDMIVAAARNEERLREFDFVGPFLRVPTVVVAPIGRDLALGLESPGSLRLALLRKHFLMPQLSSRYPRLKLVEYGSQAEVLQALRSGEADLAIGNMKVVNQLLEDQHAGALHTVGVVPRGESELYFGIRKSLPELAPVMRVALDALTPKERADIESRWLRVQWSDGVPWARVIAFGSIAAAIAALVIGALWWSNRRLRQAAAALQQARVLAEEQTAARAGFVAYLSHELRGTLGGLSSGLGLLAQGAWPAERQPELLSAMRSSATGLLDLCERSLDFERTLRGGVDLQLAPARLAEVVDKALAPWFVQARLKGVELTSRCDFDPSTTVSCDAVRLGQVLQNLVGNAVKFTASGSVGVEASLLPNGDGMQTLQFSVVDTGSGIPLEEHERLFQPFTQGAQGRQVRRGAGLGLSISAAIVAAMQGELKLAASSPAGCTFVVRLPLPASVS